MPAVHAGSFFVEAMRWSDIVLRAKPGDEAAVAAAGRRFDEFQRRWRRLVVASGDEPDDRR